MTTPNEELIARLRDRATFLGPELTLAILPEAADLLQSQAERIKALEAECEVERLRLTACGVAALGYFNGCKDEYKSASLDDVLRLNKRCTDLRAELGDLPEAQAEMLSEIKQLRAQLAAIAATEPTYMWRHEDMHGDEVAPAQALFARPVPAQNVNAELVDCLSELCDIVEGVVEDKSSVGNLLDSFTTQPARTALSKYKGAKA